MEVSLGLGNTNELNNTEMKKPLEGWHLLVAIVGVLIACWGIIYMYSKDNIVAAQKVENHEVRIQQLESDRQETKQSIREMNSKIDKLGDQNTQILIILQNKAERK